MAAILSRSPPMPMCGPAKGAEGSMAAPRTNTMATASASAAPVVEDGGGGSTRGPSVDTAVAPRCAPFARSTEVCRTWEGGGGRRAATPPNGGARIRRGTKGRSVSRRRRLASAKRRFPLKRQLNAKEPPAARPRATRARRRGGATRWHAPHPRQTPPRRGHEKAFTASMGFDGRPARRVALSTRASETLLVGLPDRPTPAPVTRPMGNRNGGKKRWVLPVAPQGATLTA